MDLSKHREEASKLSLGSSSNLILDSIVEKFAALGIEKSAKIIDIGCGKGCLLSKVKAQGYDNLYGTDYTDFGANENYQFFAHDGNLAFPEQYRDFDIILCSEVIEHIENPWAFTRNLRALGKEGTILILSTPNPESFLSIISLIFKGYFVAFGPRDYPAHITPVSTYEIKNMLELLKVKVINFFFIKNGRIPGTGLLWRSLFPFLGGKRFSENFIVISKF